MMAKIAGKEEFEGENSQLCYIRESTGIKTVKELVLMMMENFVILIFIRIKKKNRNAKALLSGITFSESKGQGPKALDYVKVSCKLNQ